MCKTDRYGLNNLFYHYSDRNKAFPSLLDAVESGGFTDYSPEGIVSFLFYRYPILKNTMFRDYGRYDTGYRVNEKMYYWKPVFEARDIPISDAAVVVDEMLTASIGKAVSGAKRVGVTLSGGLDSSVLTAMIKRCFPDVELYTYSAGFAELNEFHYSSKVAGLYSDKHRQFEIAKEEFLRRDSIMDGLIRTKCAPVHPNEIALAISENYAIADNCDIMICGEGADEIFGGYGQILRIPVNYDPEQHGAFHDFFLSHYLYFSPEEVREILTDKYYLDGRALNRSVFEEPECPKEHDNQIFYFLQRIHGRGLYERFDNTFKFTGIPGAFPFLDDSLSDFVNSLPFDYKVRWKDGIDLAEASKLPFRQISENYDIPKYILKLVAEKYLPKDIVYRNKIAFPVPYENWFAGDNDITLNSDIFKIRDLSSLSGWKKFMLLNVNRLFEIFNEYRR